MSDTTGNGETGGARDRVDTPVEGRSSTQGAGRDPDPDDVREALRSVVDPEVGLDVVTIGLIYDVRVRDGRALVRHTLTTRGCPMERVIRHGIVAAASRVPGVDDVETELVWEPEWHPGMIADDAW